MSGIVIDMEAILAPIPGDNPSGEDLRYTEVYEQIKEARRADEDIDQGAWQTDIKKADWSGVVEIASAALKDRTKDLQIAIWLTEGLVKLSGYAGLNDGLSVTASLLSDFWDTLYPLPDDGDLEYRIGPLEFMNEKLSQAVRNIPLTDPKKTDGYSWYQWQESRQGGEDKITSDVFDTAVNKTSRDFYVALADSIDASLESLNRLDAAADEKFGRDAPGLSEMKKAIEDAQHVVNGLLDAKGGRPVQAGAVAAAEAGAADAQVAGAAYAAPGAAPSGGGQLFMPQGAVKDQGGFEDAVWNDAQETMNRSGIKDALSKLLSASCSAPSVRQKNRFRLMMAKLALQADKPAIARPIIEELSTLITELHLDLWESPLWLAEVIEAHYQCLTAEGATDEDVYKANNELYPKLCSKDITKAMLYKKGG